jgi:hypothetical protein
MGIGARLIDRREMHETRILVLGMLDDEPDGRYGSPGVFKGNRRARAALSERWKYCTEAG